MNRKSF